MKEICPLCGAESEVQFLPYEVPYFGEILISTASCSSCGYHATDVMVLSDEKRRKRSELVVSSEGDLNALVVRSSSGSIEIPELGVRIEPKRGEAFITTVEGVLERVEDVARLLSRDGTGKGRAEEVLSQIAEIKSGARGMTLIIDDPTGNSAIISEKVKTSYEDTT